MNSGNCRKKQLLTTLLIAVFCFFSLANAAAVDVNVNVTSARQVIRGFGASSAWCGALSDGVMNSLYTDLGYTILRLRIAENEGWNSGNYNAWRDELSNAQKAKARGAIVFASPWNPPPSMQESFYKSNDSDAKRLRYDMYGTYVQYLNSFTAYLKNNGVELYSISVQNEPDYAHDWTWWTPQEMQNFMKNNAGSINGRVMAPESFQYLKNMSDPILNDPQALANMDILGAHFYGTSQNNMAYPLYQQKAAGKELWMTEKYFDDDNPGTIMMMAKEIHDSMVTGNMNAYIYWWITWPNGLCTSSGTVYKRAYVLGQFSKFIRPGYHRVDATANPANGVYISSYTGDNKVVVVAINQNTSSVSQRFALSDGAPALVTPYVTNSGSNMAAGSAIQVSGGSFTVTLSPQSITTFVGSLGPVPTPTPFITPPPVQAPVWSGGPYTLKDSYVDMPHGLLNGLGDFSIACWVKLNTLDAWSRIFDLGNDTNVYMMLTPFSGVTEYPFFAITTSGNSGEQGITGNIPLETGLWQHLAVVKSGNTGILYINTREAGRNTGMTLKPADLGNTINNYIGKSQWPNDPDLNGDMDKFVVFNRALSVSEVVDLGNNPPCENCTRGDVNGDGNINIVDALLMAQHYVGLNPPGFLEQNSDVDCNGTIDIIDALLVAQYYVGLIANFNCLPD